MSGSYQDTSGKTMMMDMAQAEACIAPAMTECTQSQAQAERFMAEHGAAVNGGHSPVGGMSPVGMPASDMPSGMSQGSM